MSTMYTNSQFNFGYNITNYIDVNEDYGTLADFHKLVAKAKSLELKVIFDFVANHSSHEHERLKESVQRIKSYDEHYI